MEIEFIDIVGVLILSVVTWLVCRLLHYNERRVNFTASFLTLFSAMWLFLCCFILKEDGSLLKDVSVCLFAPLYVLGYWIFCRPQSKMERIFIGFVCLVGLVPLITRLFTILAFALFGSSM